MVIENLQNGDSIQQDLNLASQIWNDYQMMDERIQIGETIFLMDVSGVDRKIADEKQDAKLTNVCSVYIQVRLLYQTGLKEVVFSFKLTTQLLKMQFT